MYQECRIFETVLSFIIYTIVCYYFSFDLNLIYQISYISQAFTYFRIAVLSMVKVIVKHAESD